MALVSIICLSYNHAPFLAEALQSVFAQTYTDWELLIVDDASQDESVAVITKTISAWEGRQVIRFLKNKENQGNCKSFNLAYAHAEGAYILDLAGDDVLLPHRLASQVALFDTLPAQYGVIFSNAQHIDEAGKVISTHHALDAQVPTGDIYEALFRRYFICTPTMLMRRQVLDELGGYDETLSYEDFDFWVRSARTYLYHYQPEITTLKRKVKNSLSAHFYLKKRNAHLESTLRILEKALLLNQSPTEHKALAICTAYHARQAFFMECFELVEAYYVFWQKIPHTRIPAWARALRLFSKMRLKVFGLYKVYLWFRK